MSGAGRWWRSPALHIAVKAVIGLALFGVLVARLDLAAIVRTFHSYSVAGLAGAFALFVLSWPIASIRWKLFAPQFAFRDLFVLSLIGQFYAVVLPGQIAGEAVKAYRLAKGQSDPERLALSVALDRLIGTIALLLVAVLGIALTRHALPSRLRLLLIGLAAILSLSVFAFRLRPVHTLTHSIVERVVPTARPQLKTRLLRLIDAWRDFSCTPWRLGASLLIGIVLQIISVAIYATLAADLGITVALADWFWIIALTSLAILLPVSIGGIGLREGALIGCLGYLGIAGEPAIVLSVGTFLVTLSGALAGGVLELLAIHPPAKNNWSLFQQPCDDEHSR